MPRLILAAVAAALTLTACATTDARVDPNTCLIRDPRPDEPRYDSNCIESAREAAAAREAIERRRPPAQGGQQQQPRR